MIQYHNLMKFILDNGVKKTDRTGVGTRSIFGYQMRFNLSDGFPLLTTKRVHFKSILHELLWFIRGDTKSPKLKKSILLARLYKKITAVTPINPP